MRGVWTFGFRPTATYSMVEHSVISAVTSKIVRTPTEHIDSICRLKSEVYFDSICSVETLDVQKDIAKSSFQKSKNAQPRPVRLLARRRVNRELHT